MGKAFNRKEKINTSNGELHSGKPAPLRAEFIENVTSKPHVVSFDNWGHRGELAEQLVAAYIILNKKNGETTREVTKNVLTPLLEFLDFTDPECSMQRVDNLKNESISAFLRYLEGRYAKRQRRNAVWLVARRHLLEMLAKSQGSVHPIHIPLTPWPKSGGRGVAAKKVELDSKFTAIFAMPGGRPPQVVEFPEWVNREAFGSVLVAAFRKLNAHKAFKTRKVRRLQLRPFLDFLEQIDPDKKMEAVDEFDSTHALLFKEYLDKTGMIDRTKRKIWNNFRAIMLQMIVESKSDQKLNILPRPWPGASKRGVHSEAMSIGEAGALLRACTLEIQGTLENAERYGAHYQGISVSELLPFITLLAFFTNFNPDTLVGAKCSGIKAPYLGRMAIVADKGRSSWEQIASFPAADTHICSPPRLIANLLRLTSRLRNKCRPEIRDHLFIGLVLNSNSEHEIDSYENIHSSTQHHHRRRLSKKYGLGNFSLQEIRTTGARVINALFGNDVKTAQILLNHLSVDTTDGYTQQAAAAAEELSLADQMEKRNRFIRTKGKRDTRGLPSVPQSAATPGFVCADPFNPPAYLRQDAGLCAAYGACPTCPLAGVDHTCQTSFVLVLRVGIQLRQLQESSSTDPRRWARVWKPRLDAVYDVWLPRFPNEVRLAACEAAASFRNLYPFPFLDGE